MLLQVTREDVGRMLRADTLDFAPCSGGPSPRERRTT
jgi:hypothetical protein